MVQSRVRGSQMKITNGDRHATPERAMKSTAAVGHSLRGPFSLEDVELPDPPTSEWNCDHTDPRSCCRMTGQTSPDVTNSPAEPASRRVGGRRIEQREGGSK
jgi:hypothetical protein